MGLDRAYDEKRAFIRMRIDTPVEIDVGDRRIVASCRDLSASGMLIASDQPLELGTEVAITIEQEGDNRLPFKATATVARCEPAESGSGYTVGLSITAIHE